MINQPVTSAVDTDPLAWFNTTWAVIGGLASVVGAIAGIASVVVTLLIYIWTRAVKPQRLRLVQPFNYGPPGTTTILSLIRDLDIQDKHKDSLTVSASLNGINLGGSFRYDDPDREPTVRIEMYEDVKFEDGMALGTLYTGAPIRMEGKMLLRPMVRVQLTHNDTVHDVMALLPQLRAETRRYIDILMHGLADPADDAEWADAEVVHTKR